MHDSSNGQLNPEGGEDETTVRDGSDIGDTISDKNPIGGTGITQSEKSEETDNAAEKAENTQDGEDGVNTVLPPKKHKYGWLGNLFLLAVIALGIYLMVSIVLGTGEEIGSLGELIAKSDYRFALISVAVLLVIIGCYWLEFSVIIKTTTGKHRLPVALKVALLGKFYDNITPFAVGGQPMQIYYLYKKGLSGGTSSVVVLIKYFAQMFAYTVISLVIMAAGTGVLDSVTPLWKTIITIAAWIGLAVNMFLPIMVVLFAVLPKFARSLASFVVGLGHKVRIVKDKQRTLEKAEKFVGDFRSSFKTMSQSPLRFAALVFLCLLEVLLTFAFPYFIMRMFSGLSADAGISGLFTVMALNVYATQSVALIPTPGNSGALEGVGTIAFSAVAGSVLFWSVFTWRFAVYYVYIVIGLFIVVFEFIRKLINAKRSKGN